MRDILAAALPCNLVGHTAALLAELCHFLCKRDLQCLAVTAKVAALSVLQWARGHLADPAYTQP